MTRHISSWKKKEAQEIKKLASEYDIIGVANLERFPADLFQELRKKLHKDAVVKVSKTRVIKKAFEEGKTSKLNEFVDGSVALIFTKMNPFELYAFLKKNKGSAPAKPGMAAPEDLVVKAGDTGLPPGPALSDLKAAGLKTKIEGPTISIPEDTVVTRKGETINSKVANALGKLGIKPIKVGLNIIAVLEKNEIFKSEVLDIDSEKVFSNFSTAYKNSLALALEIAYLTPETVVLLVQKSFRNAKAVSTEAGILNRETVPALLSKASAQASALKGMVKEVPAEETKEKEAEPKKETEKPATETKTETTEVKKPVAEAEKAEVEQKEPAKVEKAKVEKKEEKTEGKKEEKAKVEEKETEKK